MKEKFLHLFKQLDPAIRQKITKIGFYLIFALTMVFFYFFMYKKEKPPPPPPKELYSISREQESFNQNLYDKVTGENLSLKKQIEELVKDLKEIKKTINEQNNKQKEQNKTNNNIDTNDTATKTETEKIIYDLSHYKRIIPPPLLTNNNTKRDISININNTNNKKNLKYPPPPPIQTQQQQKTDNFEFNERNLLPINDISSETIEITEEKEKEKKDSFYLPPSFMQASLLTGASAITTADGKEKSVPLLFAIQTPAVLPNEFKSNLKGCFVIGEGRGSLATERIDARLESITCVTSDGEAVVHAKINGFASDIDGRVGLAGKPYTKAGAMLVRHWFAGFLGGFGQTIYDQTQETTTNALGVETQSSIKADTDTEALRNAFKSGMGKGIQNSSQSLANFYMKLAEQTLPVIDVGSARKTFLVLTEGVELNIKPIKRNRNLINIGDDNNAEWY